MNYRTTLVLLAALVAVAVIFFYAQHQSENPPPPPVVHSLTDLKAPDVNRLTIEAADGKKIVLEHNVAIPGSGWDFTSPIEARADTAKVGPIVADLVAAKATSEIPIEQNLAGFGLDKPQYRVKIEAGDKIVTLLFGNSQAVGSGVYVQLDGATKADVVERSLLDDVSNSLESLRDKKLVDVASSADINQITITHPSGPAVSLEKTAGVWKITAPTTMPADDSAVTDLVSKLSDLEATEYVEDPTLVNSALNRPQLTVSFHIAPPVSATTQPASAAPTSAPTGREETVVFGQFDDLLKNNVFVTVSGEPSPAKISKSTMDSLNKQALDLRDKKMLAIDAAQVSTIQIVTETPAATEPSAVMTAIGLHRRKDALQLGPQLPPAMPATTSAPATTMASATTQAATQMAATVPSTAPVIVQQPSTWQLDGPTGGDAEDAAVTALLAELNPLKADRFLDKLPTTRPSKKYTIKVTTVGPGGAPVTDYAIDISDANGTDPPVASYDGLIAQVPRTLVTALTAKFERHSTPNVSVSIPGTPTGGAPDTTAVPVNPAP